MLHIILPPKESFTEDHAGATARVVADSLAGSRFRESAIVFGHPVTAPPVQGLAYEGLKSWHRFFSGNNTGLARAYIARLRHGRDSTDMPAMIEVHNRPVIASAIARAFPGIPVVLFLHNDARTMDGARSATERAGLARILAGVFSNSAYTGKCFREGITADGNGCIYRIIHLGAGRDSAATPPEKQRLILFAGRMVPEKGGIEVAEAVARVLPRHEGWRFAMVGARRFRNARPGNYENAIRKTLAPLGARAEITGHLPQKALRAYQKNAAIILAPSRWEEPAGLTVIEALAHGAALITSNRGGIPEYAGGGRAIILEEPDSDAIASALDGLLADPVRLEKLRAAAWKDYPFTLDAFTQSMDAARNEVMERASGR